jgi:hypothetical protein
MRERERERERERDRNRTRDRDRDRDRERLLSSLFLFHHSPKKIGWGCAYSGGFS